ncbi:MAG: hypothetical protein E7B11_17480 [Clostridiales bacterium]|nr:hypothetical protein [Clostridiales bacterium]MDU3242354.1 hypothetical protein [Clostridiales bacterium]
MKVFIQEYGKVIIISIIGVICMMILLFHGAFMDMVDRLKPANPNVRNEETKYKLTSLSKREKPKFVFGSPQLKLGDKIFIRDLVLRVADADGNDLKENIRYYLEDGTQVSSDYEIRAVQFGTMSFLFHAEDSQGLTTDKKFAVAIVNNSDSPEAAKLLKEWDVGKVPQTVMAKVFEYDDQTSGNLGKRYALTIDGEGAVKEYGSAGQIPWLKDYADKITECEIADTVQTENVSYWFSGCSRLEMIPKFHGVRRMQGTFQNCVSIRYGFIENTVEDISQAFKGCSEMTGMGPVFSSVSRMDEAFSGCVKLRGELFIQADPISYLDCLELTASQTGGVSLKIYGADETNSSTLKEMVIQENIKQNGSHVKYMGIKV